MKNVLFKCREMFYNTYFHLIIIYCVSFAADSAVVQMRVVKDTANYGYIGSNFADGDTPNQLIPSVQPSNFSGPELMQKLVGKCFNLTEDRYRYVFCPFQNVTQYEVSPRWNAYQGILGIWSHWYIENNTFSNMIFKNGDKCGDVERTVKIVVKCGLKEELLNVTEPTKCQYSAIFNTRYACHKDALLVYPRLDESLRKEWDQIYTDFHYGDITQKGYDLGLQRLFQKAGLSEITSKPSDIDVTPSHTTDGKFIDLLTCNKEYKKLHDTIERLNMEVETLKLLIDIRKPQNKTNKPH